MISNRNTSTQASINFEDFKQSTSTNPILASIDVIDSLVDLENGSGTLHLTAWPNHTRPDSNDDCQHTGEMGMGY
jgi:hypothetical protein